MILKIVRTTSIILSVITIILGWASWRYDLALPWFKYSNYVKAGIGILLINLFGSILGFYVFWITNLYAGLVILRFGGEYAFDRDLGFSKLMHSDFPKALALVGIGYAVTIICRIFGISNMGHDDLFSFPSGSSNYSSNSSGSSYSSSSASSSSPSIGSHSDFSSHGIAENEERKTEKEEPKIMTATRSGNFIIIRDKSGRVLGSVPAGDGLVGYTSDTVSVRQGNWIKNYNASGMSIGSSPG